MKFFRRRDLYGGLIVVLIGLVAVQQGLADDLGTLTQIGPGFMPVALGVLLVGLGISIALSSASDAAAEPASLVGGRGQWRAWLCVIAGPALFIVIGPIAGFIPASLACVFVSAMGDRTSTVLSAAALAVGVTAVGGFLFLYLFNVPFPLLQWVAP